MNLVDKVVRNARHVFDEQDVEHLIFRCEHHGEIIDPLRPRNARCEECWAITFLAQQCVISDVDNGTESLHKFHEATRKIGEAAQRGTWDYRHEKPIVRINHVDDTGTIQLTDFI